MRHETQRMEPRAAGIRWLWAAKEIDQRRMISSAQLAAEAAAAAGQMVQSGAPRAMVLGGSFTAEEEARLLAYFDVTVEDVERIGGGDFERLHEVMASW